MNASLDSGLFAPRSFVLAIVATLAVIGPLLGAPLPAEAAAASSSRVTSFVAGPASVLKGKSITVSAQAQRLEGARWANTGTVTATIYFDPDGAAPDKAFRTVRSNARGVLVLSLPATTSGKWSIRLPGQGALKASASAGKYVKVLPAPKPTSSKPASKWNCPAWAPIKGNAPSRIYHMKGQRFFTKTTPEICFTTEAAARQAGYRKSKV